MESCFASLFTIHISVMKMHIWKHTYSGYCILKYQSCSTCVKIDSAVSDDAAAYHQRCAAHWSSAANNVLWLTENTGEQTNFKSWQNYSFIPIAWDLGKKRADNLGGAKEKTFQVTALLQRSARKKRSSGLCGGIMQYHTLLLGVRKCAKLDKWMKYYHEWPVNYGLLK